MGRHVKTARATRCVESLCVDPAVRARLARVGIVERVVSLLAPPPLRPPPSSSSPSAARQSDAAYAADEDEDDDDDDFFDDDGDDDGDGGDDADGGDGARDGGRNKECERALGVLAALFEVRTDKTTLGQSSQTRSIVSNVESRSNAFNEKTPALRE